MLISGPNSRTDYHIDPHEEHFYQIRGTLNLKVHHNNEFYTVVIKEGETFCIPKYIPHSPQREDGSLGIVVERFREEGEEDCMRWYCGNEDCKRVLWEKWFWCKDLERDLKGVVEEYWGDEKKRTCSSCGWIETESK